MVSLKSLLAVYLFFVAGGLAFSQRGTNLALSATAAASESLGDMPPKKANDGNAESRWSAIPGHNSGVWFELDWQTPQLVGEVLVRQYDRFATQWDLQIWDDANGQWVTKRHYGNASERLTKDVVMRITPTQTSRIRIGNIANGPSFNEVEAYASPYEHPAVVEVASDLRGNLIGIVTDSLGASPGGGVTLTLSGNSLRGAWTEKATTDQHGTFTAPLPLGLKGAVVVTGPGGLKKTIDSASLQSGLTPISFGSARTDLSGTWKFAPNPPDGFWQPKFIDRSWHPIPVPAHWEMQGFRTDVGGYRRQFTAPVGTGRLKLRFDGVYNGADVWINGHHVAYHEGGFTPFEADITEWVVSGSNLLALRVKEHTTVSDKLDHMSLYADFPLGGIIRTPYLFRVPDVHVAELVHSVHFENGNATGVLSGTIKVANESSHPQSRLNLGIGFTTLKGQSVATTTAPLVRLGPWQTAVVPFQIKIRSPKIWTAESPNLYLLQVSETGHGSRMATFVERTGLRETKVDGTQIKIDGSPVKFRGTCHHDTHPLMGRAVTPALTRLDLQLIKTANLNSLRTSHYPPIPELVDMADEMGVYIEDEASFCWANDTNDLRNTPRIIQLTAELLARDRNHPSVFEWSICNESQFGYGFERSHEWVRRSDPSRPTSAATSSWLEIATLHNPISIGGIQRNAGINMPLLWDESLCIYQGIFNDIGEMWVDPGMRDYYAEPLPAVYRAFMDSKTVQGSMIWCWADDIFCVPGRGYEYGRGTAQSHFIDAEYRVPGRGLVGDAPWGVVDGWRRPKPEFWITKKLHSPIKLSEARIPSVRPDGTVRVAVENQYDFTNLSQVKTSYSIGSQKGTLKLNVSPRSKGDLVVSGLRGITPGSMLDLKFESSDGRLVDEYQIPIGQAVPNPPKSTPTWPLKITEESWLTGNTIRFTGRGFELVFDKDQGYLRRCVAGNQPVLIALPSIHVLPTASPLAPIPDEVEWNATAVKFERSGANIQVTLNGKYPLFEGSYRFVIHPDGVVDGHYAFTYTGEDVLAREIGWNLDFARECETFEWSRKAEWNVYPSDHIGRPHGIATAMVQSKPSVGTGSWSADTSPMGSNDFRSTKRNVNWVDFRAGAGQGVRIPSDGKHSARAMVQSDRTTLTIDDWYGGTNVGWGEWTTNYGKGKTIKKGEVLESNLTFKIHN